MAATKKYLVNYAAAEIHHLTNFPSDLIYDHCIVIPVYNETTDFVERIATNTIFASTLLILIVNQPQDDSNLTLNTNFIRMLSVFGHKRWSMGNLELIQYKQIDILLVDRFSTDKIPSKQGVGTARKIGCDLAVALCYQANLTTDWIYCTDADAHLPNNYFSLPAPCDAVKDLAKSNSSSSTASAMVFEFEHSRGPSALAQATEQYEKALKYYRNGLRWAGSSYGFYTLGSTMAVNKTHYCQVRGFPQRAGAEDFYLLNKLAKVGQVRFNPEVTIKIDARLSDRIPFGTGPAVNHILQTWHTGGQYHYYHPEIFAHLKRWLDLQASIAKNIFNLDNFYSLNDRLDIYQTAALQIEPKIVETMRQLKFNDFVCHAQKHCKSVTSYHSHFNNWFDGFKTLKFIHHMQSAYFPPLELNRCIAIANTLFQNVD